MSDERSRAIVAGPGIMLISALLFGYFGFGMSWAHQYTTEEPPRLLTMVVLLKWTLRGAAIAFVVAALLTFVNARAGNLIYAFAGFFSAIGCLVVGVWDMGSPYYSGVPAFLLLIFAAWNGYGSWTALQVLLAGHEGKTAEEP